MSTSSDPDGLLDRIRKLLAKAEDPAVTPAEADAYNAKVADLIARYGVDRALLSADRPGSDPAGDTIIALDPPYARDKAGLLWAVASAFGCRAVRRESTLAGRRTLGLHLFGMASDLERTELLYTSLLVQAAHGLAVGRPRPGEDVRAYRRSWYAGFAGAVHRRLSEAEEAARRRAGDRVAAGHAATDGHEGNGGGHGRQAVGGRSLALVLADRADLVDRRLAEAYPRTSPSRSRTLSGTGGPAGYAAGQRADLGGSRLGGRDPGALR
ncbi:MAG: DUF2786 domain-containing protein [Frankia sp.]